jgi:hypothetical protein
MNPRCVGGAESRYKMGSLTITRESIEADIADYQQRIADARTKLVTLPIATNWKEHRKVKAVERALASEIKHIYRLIGYAREALAEVQKEGSKPRRGGGVRRRGVSIAVHNPPHILF